MSCKCSSGFSPIVFAKASKKRQPFLLLRRATKPGEAVKTWWGGEGG